MPGFWSSFGVGGVVFGLVILRTVSKPTITPPLIAWAGIGSESLIRCVRLG